MQPQKTKQVTSEEIISALEKVAAEYGVESFVFLGLNSESILMASKCTKGTIMSAFEEANRNTINELFKR
ncbi:MAG: hypothetical protein LCH91_27065 [Bacteroidetes bacterium]|nr:hypothetical protein [Bacteroidota bacterium]